MGEYYLSDDRDDLYKCNLPAVELLPGGYYVIHSESDEMEDGEPRLNFRIKAQGETLYLVSQSGVIDVVNVPKMETNTTWSRTTDAGYEWKNMEQTYRASNNNAKCIQEKIDEPVFSAEGGFYADEFELELKASPESRIYYTLDGSEPDNQSILYERPIQIRDVSEEPNVYSVRNDFYRIPMQDPPPEECVEKIMVVRAIAIDADGRKSNVVTNSYLIGKEDKENYKEMYTVSLVTDPDNLFGYEEGIYILGKYYDAFLKEGGSIDTNYANRGKRSERPADIEIFDENGGRVLDRKVGIRIHGNSSRDDTQKSFSVFAREMYDGEDTIDGLFGKGMPVHKFLLYNGDKTKIKDVLISRMLADRDMATQSVIYCNVFLDGEYWGIYLLEEVYDEYYFENHYGIRQENIQIFEGATPPDVAEYCYTVPDKSEAAVYETLCQMIDVQSFIDYYAAMLYLNNTDWLSYNARCYRSIETGQRKNEDGKWRWGVWDIEGTLYYEEINTFHQGHGGTWEDDILAQTLMEHEEFRKQFVITYMDLYNNIWREDYILPVVSEIKDNIVKSHAMHMERFYANEDINEYYDLLTSFITGRKDIVFRQVQEEFSLDSEPVWLVVLSNKDGAASIRVNTSEINIPDAWWQGLYYTDYPVEIAIDEVYGENKFLGWYTQEGELLSTDDVFEFYLTEETNIICPRFEDD